MTIEWFSGSRKVKKITRSDKIIEFTYNPFGQRIIKKVNDLSLSTITTSYYAYDANGQVMGVYDINLTSNNANLNELNIYGASRVGIIDRDITLCTAGIAATPPVYPSPTPVTHILGYKKYEITNYLGNVNAVITDRKLFVSSMYEAVVIMNSDYYPFGMEMPDRNATPNKYRFGYNGMEKDDEVKNLSGSSYTTEFRQYDPRLGRWLSLDPLMAEFPWMSPYVAFDNNPVYFVDPYGLESTNPEGEPEFKEPNPDAGSEYADGAGYGNLDNEVVIKAERVKPSPLYDNWLKNEIGRKGVDEFKLHLYHKIRDRYTKGGNGLGELYYGDGTNIPDELVAKINEEVERTAFPLLKNAWAMEYSGYRPGSWNPFKRIAFMSTRALAVTSREEGYGLIKGVMAEVAFEWLMEFTFARLSTTAQPAVSAASNLKGVCFIAGTEISILNGFKPIEDIQVGDSVWSMDLNSYELSLKEVTNIFESKTTTLIRVVFNSDTIYSTEDHPFYSNNTWVEAGNLEIGDNCISINGEQKLVIFKDRIDTLVTVYNFSVSKNLNYFVSNDQILVHNTCDIVKEAVERVFSNPSRTEHLIHGSRRSSHNWQALVNNLDADEIKGIVENVLRNGQTVAYKSGKAKVMSVTHNGVTREVMVPYALDPSGKLNFSSAWVND
jgi:RHS repeat-associated protein